MALVVEDGNGLTNANSYADVAFADAYFSTRAVAAWAGANGVKEAALIRATDYIETVFGTKFSGAKAFVYPDDPASDQALEFPRDSREFFVGNANYSDVQFVYQTSAYNGTPLTKPVAIPVCLKKACCEYALRALTAALLVDPARDESGAMVTSKTETVGPISETTQFYATGGIEITQPYPAADLLLKPLLRSGGQVIRG